MSTHECWWSHAQESYCVLISGNECIWHLGTMLMSAHGQWWLLLALMAANVCTWALIITHGAHEHSRAHMTRYKHSWALCHGTISTHEHSLALMSTYENGVTSPHKSHGAMAPYSWMLLSSQEWSRALQSSTKCSWALISAQVLDLTVSKNVNFWIDLPVVFLKYLGADFIK